MLIFTHSHIGDKTNILGPYIFWLPTFVYDPDVVTDIGTS